MTDYQSGPGLWFTTSGACTEGAGIGGVWSVVGNVVQMGVQVCCDLALSGQVL